MRWVSSTANSVTLTNGSIGVGGSCTIEVEVSAANAGTYINTSNAVTSGNGGTGNTASDTLIVNGVGLALVKTSFSSNYKNVGEIVNYSYTLINTGDAILYAPFNINDDRVAGPFDCGGTTQIPVSGQIICTAPYTITDVDISAKSIKNIATAVAKDESGNDVTSPSSTVTIRLAALTLDKSTTALSYRNVGNLITYNYTLTNTGGVTLYAPFSVSDNHFGTPLACGSATSLAPGGVLTCSRTYTVTLADINAGSTTNIAVATAQDASSGGNLVTSNSDSVTVYRVTAPTLSKSFTPNEIPVGGTSTLRLTITNPNPVTLTGVSIIDNLPAGISLTIVPSGSQCGGSVSYDAANNRITLANGSIVPNGSCNVTAVVLSLIHI